MRTLDHSPAEIVRQLLIDLGLAVDPEFTGDQYTGDPWPAFYSAEPPKPDELIVVVDVAGSSQGRLFTGELTGHAGVQVTVRSSTHGDGWVKADRIRANFAENVRNQSVAVGGASYLVKAMVDIRPILTVGKEIGAGRRSIFTVDAKVDVEQR